MATVGVRTRRPPAAARTTTGDTEAAATTAAGGRPPPWLPKRAASLDGVELSLWGWSSSDAENEALTDLVDQFNEETGAVAKFQPQAEYDVALQAALASGDPPDVFYVDSFRLPDLADAGALAPVPEGAISDPDDIFPSLREAFTYDGTWYCPPKDFSTLASDLRPGRPRGGRGRGADHVGGAGRSGRDPDHGDAARSRPGRHRPVWAWAWSTPAGAPSCSRTGAAIDQRGRHRR